MVAILSFSQIYPSTLWKIMGQYLQQAKCCFEIPPNSSPTIIVPFLDTGRFLEGNMKLTIFHSTDMVECVLFLQVFNPFIHSSLYIQLCLVMKIGAVAWHCIPMYKFKLCSEVNQTFLCLRKPVFVKFIVQNTMIPFVNLVSLRNHRIFCNHHSGYLQLSLALF